MYRGCQKAVTYRTRGTLDACSVGLHFDKCKVARRGACIWSWKGWKNMLNPLKWLVKKWVPANSEHKSMSFMVRSRKTILKIPTTFWSSQIQSQKYYNTKLEGKTSLLSFKIRPDLFQISLSLSALQDWKSTFKGFSKSLNLSILFRGDAVWPRQRATTLCNSPRLALWTPKKSRWMGKRRYPLSLREFWWRSTRNKVVKRRRDSK